MKQKSPSKPSSGPAETDVVIVGAGLAGLACARELHQKGVGLLLLEASDGIGGRVRTDEVDGFLLDRGFQVLLTAYPEARRVLEYGALSLRSFYPGALVRSAGGFKRVVDPWRRPFDALRSLAKAPFGWKDRLAVAKLRRHVCRAALNELWQREERSTMEMLEDRGFSSHIIGDFFQPYFGGIFLESHLETSSLMFEFVFRMMAMGDASLPARGMGAIPEQMAAGLPEHVIRLNSEVESIDDGFVSLQSGERIRTSSIVVATQGPAANKLLPELPVVESRAVSCIYFAAEEPPLSESILVLNGEGGPVNNLAVLSNVAPSYAPPGFSLISATVLGDHRAGDESALIDAVREQLQSWYGAVVRTWRHLRTHHIPHALPGQSPPTLSVPERPVSVRPGVFVCGDHRDNTSIQGALASGRRAAEAVLG
jgi:phytoene dehydrogenase-like protein